MESFSRGFLMLKMSQFFLFFIFTFSTYSNEVPMARFEKSFIPLEKSLLSSDSSLVAENLIIGKSRIYTFQLQALGKLYSKKNKLFKNLKADFKSLEDGIGEYKKWKDIFVEAQARGVSASKLKKIQKNMDAGKLSLIKLLKKQEWVEAKKIQKYRKALSSYDFGNSKADKEFVLKFMVKALDNIADTEFDMGILEHGNGLHELRRELRWLLIEAQVLNGLIIYNKYPQICSIERFSQLPFLPIAQSKYAQLVRTSNDVKPCEISKCLFLALVLKVEEFGDLKDQIESDLNLQDILTDETPEKYKELLDAHYSELKSTGVLGELAAELKSCF